MHCGNNRPTIKDILLAAEVGGEVMPLCTEKE